MPYLHGVIAAGRSPTQKRSLIQALTDAAERVLEVPRDDVYVFLHEILGENLGLAGIEPDATKINNFSLFLREGRDCKVCAVLLESLTDAAQATLGVPRENIQVLLSELAPTNIGEGGIPMSAPKQPNWFVAGRRTPPLTR
jgi:4-oxalocrotonate tautomerase family enzyme